ncbi:MAG: adenylate/guanylate cyclase domain-containing protein [Pseudomonadota bacterium]
MNQYADHSKPTSATLHIVEWLIDQALGTHSVADTFDGLIGLLRAEGVPIARAHLAHTTLHPLYAGEGSTWTLADGLVEESYEHGRSAEVSGWSVSPIRHVITKGLGRLRRRLIGSGATLDFPILKDFAAEGLSDYFLMAAGFESFFTPPGDNEDLAGSESGMAVSFAANRETGFTDDELALMEALLRPLATVVKLADQRQVALNLAECYIGHEAGPRVLGGAIQRGDFDTTSAVTFLADLRGSTELSASLPRDEYIATLNEFFDCAVGAVEEQGGEPLTFIGDGVLAIFPIDALGPQRAREAAETAALRASDALDALNRTRAAEGKPALGFGIALHSGDLEYGNIGSLRRHVWSVVGAVVNETARLEGATKTTGERIVASRAFVDGLPGEDWRALGAFDLKGVPGRFEVFGVPAPASTVIEKEAV